MTKTKAQEIGLAFVLVTICISFFSSVILSAFKMPVEAGLQNILNTLMVGVAAGVPTWFAASKIGEIKGEVNVANAQLAAAMGVKQGGK